MYLHYSEGSYINLLTDSIKLKKLTSESLSYCIVISVDGSREIPIIRGFCDKINGPHKYVLYPYTPLKKQSGLSALDVVKIYASESRIQQILFLVEREYFPNGDSETEIKTKLERIGVEIINIEEIHSEEGSLKILARCGGHDINIIAVVMGHTKFIEENIAELIQTKYGINISPSKSEIKLFLNKKGLTLYDLIRSAGINNLKTAFPCLFNALIYLEQVL